jgi:hypothetical protein
MRTAAFAFACAAIAAALPEADPPSGFHNSKGRQKP